MRQQVKPLTETVYYVLVALVERRHGYGIMQFVRSITDDRVVIGAGTLYGALSALQEKGWIVPDGDFGDPRKKEYRITPAGLIVLDEELDRLEAAAADGKAVMNEVSR